jgi:hypothetical protein
MREHLKERLAFTVPMGTEPAAAGRHADAEDGGELRCRNCGYGVVAYRAPSICPMCRTSVWEPGPWRPFTRRTGGSPLGQLVPLVRARAEATAREEGCS